MTRLADPWPLGGWRALVPDDIARSQARWEDYQRVIRALAAGADRRTIALHLGVTQQTIINWEYLAALPRNRRAPVARWLDDPAEVHDLARAVARIAGYHLGPGNWRGFKLFRSLQHRARAVEKAEQASRVDGKDGREIIRPA